MPLFRPQALAALSMPPAGECLPPRPPGWRAGLTLAILLLLAVILCLRVIELPRVVHATGRLVPRDGLLRLPAGADGYAMHVAVRRGDRVRAGQPLFTVTADIDPNAGAIGAVHEALRAEAQAIDRRLDATRQLRVLRVEQYRQQHQDEQTRLAARQQAVAVQQSRLQRARSTEGTLEAGHARGVVTTLERDQATASRLEHEAALTELNERLGVQAARIAALPREEASALAELDAMLAALTQQRRALDQRRGELALNRRHTVRSPVNGVVLKVHLREGEPVSARMQPLTLLADDSPLEANLVVPAAALGFVRAGSAVHLHLEPFPHQKFGTLAAEVRETTPVIDSGPDGDGQPGFRVVATPRLDHMAFNGMRWPLLPDMRLTAKIMLERRMAWEWLFEPLLAIARRYA